MQRRPTDMRSSRLATRVLSFVSVVGAVVIHLTIHAGFMLGWGGQPWMFRNYFMQGQLAYLVIAENAANGDLSSVEPVSQTGSIYYPRAYYLFLGVAARAASTDVATMWSVCGLLAQVMLVGVLAATCVLLTRRWWAGFFGFVPFVLGTMSWLVGDRGWMTLLDSHAALWGPYAVMYTLNAESVALSLSGVALLGVLLVAAGRIRGRAAWVVAIAACLLIGLLAGVQTYSFLVSIYLLAGCAAAVGLVMARSKSLVATTAGLLVVVVVGGPTVAAYVGPLATLALGVSPALPGLIALGRRTGPKLLWCVAALALGAAPQVLDTVFGMLSGDAFLSYRDSSSTQLGVPWEMGLVSAAAVVPVMALLVAVGLRRRHTLWIAVPTAAAVVWTLVATNDLWGANQEPYRFWLDTYVLVAVLVVPLTAWMAVETLGTRQGRATLTDGGDVRHAPLTAPVRAGIAAGLAFALLVAGVASVDVKNFRWSVATWGYVRLDSPRYLAGAILADTTDGGLVVTDPCLDPWVFKTIWGGPVADFHPGLAWPANVDAIGAVKSARNLYTVDLAAAAEGDVRWLVSTTACNPGTQVPPGATLMASQPYEEDGVDPAGVVQLWRLPPPPVAANRTP